MMKNFTVIAILTFALLGCTKHEAKSFSCLHGDVNHDDMNITTITIDTGVLRDKPVNIMNTDLFFNRLKASFLWEEVDVVGKNNSEFMHDYIFPNIHGILYTRREYFNNKSKDQITEIKYRRLDSEKRKNQEHNLSDQEKQAMIEVINIVIDDKTKSTEIMKELYQKYLVKIKNNDTLTGGLLHTYVLYNGLQFEFWGVHRPTHKRAKCVESNFTELVIQ